MAFPSPPAPSVALDTLVDPLDAPLFPTRYGGEFRRDENTMRAFIDMVWPLQDGQRENLDDFRAFIKFLDWECRSRDPSKHAATTFAQVVTILNVIRANPALPMKALRQKVRESGPVFDSISDDSRITRSVEFTIWLCYMINVRHVMPGDPLTLKRAIPWPDDHSLTEVIAGWQRQTPPTPLASEIDIPTIPMLEKVAGFDIHWTNDLMNHLKVDNRRLYIFQHVSVLKSIRESDPCNILPADFIDETLNTIDLVLPISEPACNTWIAKALKKSSIDPGLRIRADPRSSPSTSYHWCDRLSVLCDAFQRAAPQTMVQFWFDRRDMSKWWAFWLVVSTALLTVLFGLVQSIAGIMQVVVTTRQGPTH